MPYVAVLFDFDIKIRKAKQKIIAFVAAAFKALLTVSKANVRFSRRKLYACDIYDLLWNVLSHISPYQHTKRCANRSQRTEKHKLRLLSHKLIGTGIFQPYLN